jgi:hypothetical protein
MGFPRTAVISNDPGADMYCPLAGAGVPGLMGCVILTFLLPLSRGVQNANLEGQMLNT